MREDLFVWSWVVDNLDVVAERSLQHVTLTAIAVGIGMVISLPLGVYCYRHRRAYGPSATAAGILYTIPSLALFAMLVPFTGLTITSAEIGLVSYTLLILVRNTVAGLRSVPEDAKEAALGMGFSRRQLLWSVELPLALPVVVAGIRIATVTVIGLVTVTALIDQGGLGYFILLGLDRFFSTATILGAVLSVALAVAADRLLALIERLLTPWSRRVAG
jgi:osmoprotectant transport system permease protein